MGLFDGGAAGQDAKKLEEAGRRHLADPSNLLLANALIEARVKAGDRAGAVDVVARTGGALRRAGRHADAIAVYSRVNQLDPKGELTATFLIQHALKALRDEAAQATAQEPPANGGAETVEISPAAIADARRQAAAQIPLMKDVPAALLATVIASVIPRSVDPGEVVFLEGTPGTSLLLIVAGELSLNAHDDLGREISLGTLGAGDVAGEISFLSGVPRSATLLGKRRSEVLELPRSSADALLRRHRKVMEALQQLAKRRALETMLAKSRAFRSLTREERAHLAQRLLPLTAPAGTRIVTQGESDSNLYVLQAGEVEVTANHGGQQVHLWVLRPHEVFGDVAAVHGIQRSANVTATTEIEYYALGRADLADVVAKNPQVGMDLDELQMERFVATAQVLAAYPLP